MKFKCILGNWIGIVLLLIMLMKFHILRGTFQTLFFLISASFLLTLIVTILENVTQKHIQQGEVHYENLDGVRYFCSILVIVLHLRPFLGTFDFLDLIINYILGRVCVPIFFFTTSYFIAKKEKTDPQYIKKYIRSLLPVYFIWSLLYLPILISFLMPYIPQVMGYLNLIPSVLRIPIVLLSIPVGLMIALLYSGVYYHLWYFPALILSLLVLNWWKRRHRLVSLLFISFFLILFGAMETYYGVLPDVIKPIVSSYFKVFVTTRNFLFFGLFYITFGYVVGKRKFHSPNWVVLKVIGWGFVLVMESLFIRGIDRFNSNILLSCIPFVYYLFCLLIYNKPLYHKKRVFPLRNLYKYYYLIHPLVIYLFQRLIFPWSESIFHNCFLEVFLILFITHIGSLFLLWIKSKFPRLIL